jgi:hypothetical protein
VKPVEFVFIVGSPRSGTTVLGEILDRHERICQWYEPYFVWDKKFRYASHDQRSEKDATPDVKKQIFADFSRYRKDSENRIIVDKSPRNSLKIPFVRAIFPSARFIHILRDGRDATLSIHKEWQRRINIVSDRSRAGAFNYGNALKVIGQWLKRQPFLRDRMRALWFETHGHLIDRSRHLNRRRWNGRVGWGPRFPDWESTLESHTLLQFNAFQWLSCTESILREWPSIPGDRKLELRYEQMITDGPEAIDRVLDFLGLQADRNFYERIPKLNSGNSGKWREGFTLEQAAQIAPIITSRLCSAGYESDPEWYSQLSAE